MWYCIIIIGEKKPKAKTNKTIDVIVIVHVIVEKSSIRPRRFVTLIKQRMEMVDIKSSE